MNIEKETVRLTIFLVSLASVALVSTGNAQSPTEAVVEVQDCVVRFAKEVNVPALASGRVGQVHVTINDAVKADSPIARLDDRSLLIRRRSAQLQLAAARRDVQDEAENRHAESSVQRSRAEAARAERQRERAELEVDLREADLAVIDQRLSHLRTETPLAGVVLEINRSEGEWIEKGETIATVARIDRLHVHALLSSDKISPAVCRNLPVSVFWRDPTTGAQRSLRGKILSVDPQRLPGGRYRLHAEIVNQNRGGDSSAWLLYPGVNVRMKVYASAATAHNPRHLQR